MIHHRQRLTLSLGLRYEIPTPFIDVNDAISGFHTGVESERFPAAPAGWSIDWASVIELEPSVLDDDV